MRLLNTLSVIIVIVMGVCLLGAILSAVIGNSDMLILSLRVFVGILAIIIIFSFVYKMIKDMSKDIKLLFKSRRDL